ncbi:MAG TPA: gluconeogenesis factor YvcK family protein [Bryobacteraceae bacterium]|nr:gluconeogenesis factor YvcK family protein [Bryobacteraceae bacterium]
MEGNIPEADTHDSGPLRIVSIGGGTGLSTLLRGLKRYVRRDPMAYEHPELPAIEVAAIVTVTDDGGSSGRLRRDFDVLPPGDIRNCMVALSEDEALLSRLFQYRFSNGRGLKGHSFGNLFLTALNHLTGDFAEAVKLSSEVLASKGHIYPSTAANVTLEARLESGRTVRGESRISRTRGRIESVRLRPRRCRPLPETLAAIAQADLITLGPGSLFTSVVPNLLVEGIPEAIRNSPALKAYFVNLMWQPGETTGFNASDHVKAIYKHAKIPLIDYAVVNTGRIRPALIRKYELEQAQPVVNDTHKLEAMGIRVIGADLLGENGLVRHDPEATARIAVELAAEGRRRKLHRAAGIRAKVS